LVSALHYLESAARKSTGEKSHAKVAGPAIQATAIMRFIKSEAHTPDREVSLILTRRRFVQAVAVAGLATSVQGKFNQAGAETISHSAPILTGNHFDLAIEPHHVDFTGRRVKALAINGSLPGPTLKWREGDTVTVAVTNHLPEATSACCRNEMRLIQYMTRLRRGQRRRRIGRLLGE
jgi:hypothetical protein